MADHHDFNPNGPNPPKIPRLAKRWDFSRIWSGSAHIRLYDFFGRWPWYAYYWPDGSSADWAILGGAFLGDIRGQSQVLTEARRVAFRARARAQSLCAHLNEGETNTFSDRGYALVRADIPSTNVALSLGRFSLYWKMEGRVGPKVRRPDGSFRATYRATVTWTLYDYYDFAPYVIVGWVPDVLGVAHPFHITATWTDVRGGIVTCPAPATDDTPGGVHDDDHDHDDDDEEVCYELSGVLVMTNDCDGKLESLPTNVLIVTELFDEEGNQVEAQGEFEHTGSVNDLESPSVIGIYTIKVVLPENFGEPTKWRTPKVTRADGSDICGAIPCPRQRCLDMATRPRYIPVTGKMTVKDIRVACRCAG